MNKKELYEMLDIEDGSQFEYFENFADLIEYEAEIETGAICNLLEEINLDNFIQLCNNYFTEIMDGILGDNIELYTLLLNVKRSFMGMAKQSDEENILVQLAEEISKFRYWYTIEEGVECSSKAEENFKICTISEALAMSRYEALDNVNYTFDFSGVLDYEIDEYVMSFSDLISEEDEKNEDE